MCSGCSVCVSDHVCRVWCVACVRCGVSLYECGQKSRVEQRVNNLEIHMDQKERKACMILIFDENPHVHHTRHGMANFTKKFTTLVMV